MIKFIHRLFRFELIAGRDARARGNMLKLRFCQMLSFNSIKFYAAAAVVFALFPACRVWQKTEGETPAPTPFVAEELKSEIPFSTKEPEIFQTEIVITTDGKEQKNFVARNGANRRFDYNVGAKNQVLSVQTDKNYLILPGKKIYAESYNAENAPAPESLTDFLTTGWLNEKTEAKFERLENEGNLTKYRVRLGASDASEILIYIDEARGFPARQEFYSINDGEKTLKFSVELRNLQLQTNEDTFAIQKDYRKVPIAEFRKTLRSIPE